MFRPGNPLLSLAALLVVLGQLSDGADRVKDVVEPNVNFRLVIQGKSLEKGGSPDDAFLLSLGPTGIMRDIRGGEITDAALKAVLSKRGPGDPDEKTSWIKLQLSQQGDTSLDTLVAALARIRTAADPKRVTVVYVAVKGLKPKKKD